MLESLALNALSISAAMFAFNRLLDAARRNGSLLNTGE
jgi:hypothetical protein